MANNNEDNEEGRESRTGYLFLLYEQAGEEARHHDELINSSYHISILIYSIFLGVYSTLLRISEVGSAIMAIVASMFSLYMYGLLRAYAGNRRAAWSCREDIETELNDLVFGNENHSPLAVQREVLSGEPRYVERLNWILKKSNIDFDTRMLRTVPLMAILMLLSAIGWLVVSIITVL